MKIPASFYINILGILLTLYIASIIIFRQHFTVVTHLLGSLLIVYFVFLYNFTKKQKIKGNSVVMYYGGLTALALASSFWAVDFGTAADMSMLMIYLLITLYILYTAIKINHLENYFLYGILLGTLVNYILLLGPINPPFAIYNSWRAIGTVGNANVLALVMNMSIASSILYLYLYRPKRFFLLYLNLNVFFALYIIIITASKKGTILATLLIFVFILMNFKSIKSIVGMAALVLVSVMFFQATVDLSNFFDQIDLLTGRFDSFSGQMQEESEVATKGTRLYYINLGLDLISERSMFGYGIDNFRVFAGTYSHNNYIELLVGVGFVGLALFMSIYFSILYKINKIANKFLKFNLFILIVGFMIMDVAMVSYANKVTLFFILFVSIVAENNAKSSKFKEVK